MATKGILKLPRVFKAYLKVSLAIKGYLKDV
jgi:hypothetical protein